MGRSFEQVDRHILCNYELTPAETAMCECNTDDIVSLFVCFFVTTDVASGCEKAVTEMGTVNAEGKLRTRFEPTNTKLTLNKGSLTIRLDTSVQCNFVLNS